MARQRWAFVAGDQVMQIDSHNVLDAYLALSIKAKHAGIAAEFHKLPITAYSSDGQAVGVHTWEEWKQLVMAETYGPDWQSHCEHANDLIR